MLSLFLVLFSPAVSCVFYNILFFGDWTIIVYPRLELSRVCLQKLTSENSPKITLAKSSSILLNSSRYVCRSRNKLHKKYFLAKIDTDTAENWLGLANYC